MGLSFHYSTDFMFCQENFGEVRGNEKNRPLLEAVYGGRKAGELGLVDCAVDLLSAVGD